MVFVVGTNSSNAAFVPVSKIAVETPDVGLVPDADARSWRKQMVCLAEAFKGANYRSRREGDLGETQAERALTPRYAPRRRE
jgi:hypothetical protein